MKRILIFALTAIMLVLALCIPSFATSDCEHEWVDARCTICGDYCDHYIHDVGSSSPAYVDGVCSTCGYVCEHPSWDRLDVEEVKDDGIHYIRRCICSSSPVSETVNPHTYVDGVCSVCSHVCLHSEKDDNGDCVHCTPKADVTPDTPSTPSEPPSPSAPSVSDDDGFSFGSFIALLGGAAAIFVIIYAVSALKARIR